MYCEKVEQAGNGVYGKLVELAFIRGIDVYEIESPECVLGIYHDYQDEGMYTKAIMIGKGRGKEYILARMLSRYVLQKGVKAFILSEKSRITLLSERADIMALRLYVFLKEKRTNMRNTGTGETAYLET
ncbi:MAG TPA: hypothetical protein VHT34_13510 [Clostridia bacterium]|nr:hypothetical protein [Clostridia bacterium]